MADHTRGSKPTPPSRPPISGKSAGAGNAAPGRNTGRSSTRSRRGPRFALRVFALIVVPVLTVVALVNVSVDPREIWFPTPDRWTVYREELVERPSKAQFAATQELDTIFLGDSRVLMGLDPADSAAESWGRVHNLAFADASISESCRMLDLVLARHAPRLVVWGFPPERLPREVGPSSGSYEQSLLNPRLNIVSYHAPALWSWETTGESWQTLRRVIRQEPTGYSRGWIPGEITKRKPRAAFVSALPDRPLKRRAISNTNLVARSPAIELGRTLMKLRSRGVQVMLFVPPVHALYLDRLLETPLGDDYQTGYDTLVPLVEALNRQPSNGPPIELWDFTAFSGLNAEPVVASQSGEPMQYYLDARHFRSTLGHEVLARLARKPAAKPSFGRYVKSSMLDRQAEWLESRRQRYQQWLSQVDPDLSGRPVYATASRTETSSW